MLGQIIIVTGTSGSGKSTACEAFAKRSDEFWLLYGLDDFLSGTYPAKFGHHGPRSHEGIYAHPVDLADPDGTLRWSFGPHGTKAMATLHEWIAAASRQGCNIIVDSLMMIDPPVLQDAVRRLAGLPVLFVALKPPFEILAERVANRAMDKKMPTDLLGEKTVRIIIDRLSRLRPWFYDAVYASDCFDLEIDTALHDPDEVCAMIERRLVAGPATAFDMLYKRFAKDGDDRKGPR